MAIKMHVDDVRQECIALLTEEPQNFDADDIAQVYCVLTGRDVESGYDYDFGDGGVITFED